MSDCRVFRYRLPVVDEATIDLPFGAEVLSVGPPRTGDDLDLWALVRPGLSLTPRQFRVVGTGNPMPDDCGRFVGTVPTHSGTLIWHVFEVAP